MIKRMLLVLTLMLFAACTSSDGPILVGQGTGESEYSLAFARMNLVDLLRTCNGVCALDNSQREFLDEIIKHAPRAPNAHFEISGSDSMYRFTNPKFTDIYFNHNRLWQDAEGKVPFDIPYAVGIWIDVLTYTRGVKSAANAGSVKSELINALRQRIVRVAATFEQETPFVAMTWKGKTSDRLYIRNSAFENTDLIPILSANLGCDAGAASDIVVNSVRFAELTKDADGALSVRMETTQNFNCLFEARRSRAKIIFQTTPGSAEGGYSIREDSFKVFSEGE